MRFIVPLTLFWDPIFTETHMYFEPQGYTPPRNMESEKGWFIDYCPLKRASFQVPC